MLQQNFSQNMAVLKEIFPLLAEEISRAEDGPESTPGEVQVEAAASGAPTLAVRGLYVHSKRDPEREAERLVEAAIEASGDDEGPALVLGFALGYAARALAARLGGRPLIIVEKRADILKKALEKRDLRALLSRRRLVIVLGGDGEGVTAALSLFEGTPGVPPLIVRNRALMSIDGEWYAAVEERIRTWTTRTNVNRATQKRFGKRWVRNLSQNLETARDIPGVSRLLGLLEGRGIPVFLAAAGPSLDTAAPLLGDICRRCLVVAVDTSFRFLTDRGIESDFVVSVDPQYWNFRHLDRIRAPKTRLVAESAVYPAVLRHPFGGAFLCGSLFPLGRFIESRLEPKGDLGAGGSVATSAWDFIRLLGAATVWIAGLDLSFPELKTHFRGALFEEKSHAESGRFVTAETGNFRSLRDGQPFTARSMGGNEVLTDKRLSLYAAWFENRFNLFPGIRNVSLFTGGLALKGIEAASKEELLSLPERREEIENLLAEVYSGLDRNFCSEEAARLRAVRYRTALVSLLKGLEEIRGLALDAAECAENAAIRNSLGHLSSEERERAVNKLDAANKTITESEVKEVAGFLFPETDDWEAEISERTGEPLSRYLEFSGRFYRALSEAAGYNLHVLSKVPVSKTDIIGSGREILH